jgi:hypothetical protein
VPPPWSAADIPSCDTRSLVDWGDKGATDSNDIRIPWGLTVRMPESNENPSSSNLGLAVVGVLLAFFLIGYSLWQMLHEGQVEDASNWGGVLTGVFLLICAYLLTEGTWRRWRRRVRARLLALPEAMPPEALKLGIPVALHQVSMYWRTVCILVGGLLCGVAVACVFVFLQSQGIRTRLGVAGVVGLAGGMLLIWQGLYRAAVAVLVFKDGMLNLGTRQEIWRWDDIIGVWLKPDGRKEPFAGLVCTICRKDGERFTFSREIDFLQNQLVVRVQHELCRRMLPEIKKRLDAGEGIEFGPLKVTAEGIQRGEQMRAWADITIKVQPTQVVIYVGGRDWCSIGIGSVPNLAVLCSLVSQ